MDRQVQKLAWANRWVPFRFNSLNYGPEQLPRSHTENLSRPVGGHLSMTLEDADAISQGASGKENPSNDPMGNSLSGGSPVNRFRRDLVVYVVSGSICPRERVDISGARLPAGLLVRRKSPGIDTDPGEWWFVK